MIDAYLQLLAKNRVGRTGSVIMDTKFYFSFASANGIFSAVRHVTRPVDGPSSRKVLVPFLDENKHWFMIVIDIQKKNVLSLDGLDRDRTAVREDILGFLKMEFWSRSTLFKRLEWRSSVQTVPQQRNEVDGGPFVCMFAAFASNNLPMTFTAEDVPRMRRRIAWSIANRRLWV